RGERFFFNSLENTLTSAIKPKLEVEYTGGNSSNPPTATNDSYSVNEDTTLSVAAPGILTNDSDPDGDALSADLVTLPAHSSSFSFSSNGSFTYRPLANFNGTDSFTYKASDGNLQSGTATVTITVNPVPDAPVAVNNSYSLDEDTTLTVAAPGVLG